MKNQININALFHKAGNLPVESSFGETKELFLSTVGKINVKVEKKKSQILTPKNGLVMIAIVSTLLVSILLIPSENSEKPQSQDNLIEKEESKVKEPANSSKKEEVKFSPKTHLGEMIAPVIEYVEEIDSIVKDLVFYADPRLDLMTPPDLEYELEIPSYPQPYTFPVLTDEQKSANSKRKKKMLKALVKKDKKSYAYVPSGSFTTHGKVVSVQSFHMQTAEVSNIEYKTFLFDLLIHDRKDEFLLAKPDQAMWTKTFGDSLKPMQDQYFSHEAYNDYPVVNVSRIGAEMYCIWLTVEARKFDKGKYSAYINDVRIPVRPEWELAASGSGEQMPFPWGGPLAQNMKGCFLANFDVANYKPQMDTVTCEGMDTTKVAFMDGAQFPARTKTYNPNTYGLYNMSGNVAEMVYGHVESSVGIRVNKDSGTAGGGWMSSFEEIKIDGKDGHSGLTEAHPNVGFRVVMTYLKTMK